MRNILVLPICISIFIACKKDKMPEVQNEPIPTVDTSIALDKTSCQTAVVRFKSAKAEFDMLLLRFRATDEMLNDAYKRIGPPAYLVSLCTKVKDFKEDPDLVNRAALIALDLGYLSAKF